MIQYEHMHMYELVFSWLTLTRITTLFIEK
jgi:hypothetical protein